MRLPVLSALALALCLASGGSAALAASATPSAPYRITRGERSQAIEQRAGAGAPLILATTRSGVLRRERGVKPRSVAARVGAPRFPKITEPAHLLDQAAIILGSSTPTIRRMALPILRRAAAIQASGKGKLTLTTGDWALAELTIEDGQGTATLGTREDKINNVSVTWPKQYARGEGSVTHKISGEDNLYRRWVSTTRRRPIANPAELRASAGSL